MSFQTLREFGHKLVQEQPELKMDVQRAQRRIQTMEHQTKQYWEQHNAKLERELRRQKIEANLAQIEAWTATKEAFLDGLVAGDSTESVEEALNEHCEKRRGGDGLRRGVISQSKGGGG